MTARRSQRAAAGQRAGENENATRDGFASLPQRYRAALLAAVIVAVAANAYAPVFQCGYVWDDDSYVTQNPTLHDVDGLRRIWFDLGATPQYYPLVFTSFWIEYQMFGLNPAVSHAINVLLHCACALLAWRVLLALGAAAPVAWAAALVFAVHPVHVESVAWITERKNVLSGIFYLAALLAYLRFDRCGRTTPEAQSKAHPWRYYALALSLFVAALLSKTVTSTLPIVILLLIWYQHGRVTRVDVARVAPFLLLGIAFGCLTVWVERHQVGAVGADWNLSPVERVLLAGRAAWFYAGKLIWPHPLVFIYPRWQIDSAVAWQYLFPAAALALVAVAWRLRRSLGRGPLTAILCFGVTLAPALGFVNIFPMKYSFVADHFQYLASLAIIALIAGAAWWLFQTAPRGRALVAVACLAWVGVLVAFTWRQVSDYVDVETLWTHTLDKNPDAWIAAHNLGMLHMERHEYPEAERYFTQVVEIQPDNARAQNNLGLLELYKRNVPGAIARLEESIDADPNYLGARINLCRLELIQGHVRQAEEQYARALAVEPGVAESQLPLALEIAHAADPEILQQFLDDALIIQPTSPRLISELAWALVTSQADDLRDPPRALSLARKAVETTGGRDAKTLVLLAAACASSGEYARAADVARQALELARQTGHATLTTQIKARQAAYERGEPYSATAEQGK